MPDGEQLRFSDFGSVIDTQNNFNQFEGKIAFPGLEASALEIPRGLELSNLTVTVGFDDLAYPQLSQLLRDQLVLDQIATTVGYSIDGERFNVFHGYVANSAYNGVSLTLELESALSLLSKSKVFKTGTSCGWAVVGGTGCSLDLNTPDYTKNRQLVSISPDRLSFDIDNTVAVNHLNLGAATFQIGNLNVVLDILGNKDYKVFTFQRLPLAIAAPYAVKLSIGCNKSYSRCKELGNVGNFRGSPPTKNFLINQRNLLSGTKDYSAE